MDDLVFIGVRLPRELWDQVRRTAERRRTSLSSVIRAALATETRHDGDVRREDVMQVKLGRPAKKH